MNTKYIISIICIAFFSIGTYAQVKISAEIRPRTEFNHGVKTPAYEDQKASLLTSQRSRLNLSFQNENFAIGMVLQDVRLWGSEPQLTTNGNNVTYLHQAWAEWFIDQSFSIKAGRQELAYDDQRILGSVGWAQQARSHDIVLFKYRGDFNMHLGLAYNNSSLNNNFYNGPDAYKAMQFLWLNRKGESYTASILLLNNGVPYWKNDIQTEQGIRYSQTLGTHIQTKLAGIDLTGNLYYQLGKDVTNRSISALNVSIDGTFALSDKANIGGGYEHLSGTDQTETEYNYSFNPLYGTNHKFNGFMDYFYVGNHINNVGLNDLYIKGNVKPGKVKFNGSMHFFGADGIIVDQNKGLGTELDLWFGYTHKGQVQLDFGYSHLFASDALYAIKGIPENNESNNWAWMMLTFKPTLFEK
nr:alginate export family protein [uncultured Carboxylicivirga sp.]